MVINCSHGHLYKTTPPTTSSTAQRLFEVQHLIITNSIHLPTLHRPPPSAQGPGPHVRGAPTWMDAAKESLLGRLNATTTKVCRRGRDTRDAVGSVVATRSTARAGAGPGGFVLTTWGDDVSVAAGAGNATSSSGLGWEYQGPEYLDLPTVPKFCFLAAQWMKRLEMHRIWKIQENQPRQLGEVFVLGRTSRHLDQEQHQEQRDHREPMIGLGRSPGRGPTPAPSR